MSKIYHTSKKKSILFVHISKKFFGETALVIGQETCYDKKTDEKRENSMLKISNIKIPASRGQALLKSDVAELLRIREQDIRSMEILKLSVDSRKKPEVYFVYTAAIEVENEPKVLAAYRGDRVSPLTRDVYEFPFQKLTSAEKPVIVGMGPAGLFAALAMAEAGLRPILLERGKAVEARAEDVAHFWKTGELNTVSNVQFGEGGAGTFSDGKLTTGINDRRISYVLRRFVEFGAPEDILYLSKPHVGTDKLRIVVKNMREYLLALGCEVRFEHKVTGLTTKDGNISSLLVSSPAGEYTLPAVQVIFAPGNSARDTFRMLHTAGAALEAKNFAVGVRIEHLQKDIDMTQYGQAATLGTLPPADYKLAVHLENGRSVFTFCVCPGGVVVASSSENGCVATNGMSEYNRDGENINGGLLVAVSPDDFPNGVFRGMEFQEQLEKSAFAGGGGDYSAPAQLVGDFLAKKPSVKMGRVCPTYQPGVRLCNLWDVLPAFLCEALSKALLQMEKKIRGFSDPEAVLTAVETRSSSPIRILRDKNHMSNIGGVYPCGEGAGYAGGITSAAVDGIKCAEALCHNIFITLSGA